MHICLQDNGTNEYLSAGQRSKRISVCRTMEQMNICLQDNGFVCRTRSVSACRTREERWLLGYIYRTMPISDCRTRRLCLGQWVCYSASGYM